MFMNLLNNDHGLTLGLVISALYLWFMDNGPLVYKSECPVYCVAKGTGRASRGKGPVGENCQ